MDLGHLWKDTEETWSSGYPSEGEGDEFYTMC